MGFSQPTYLVEVLRDVGGGREAELLHPLEEALVAVAARHPQEVPRRLRQLEDVADVDDVAELEVELRGEAARQRLLLDDLGEADLVAAEVVVLVEEPRRQLVVDQRAAGKEPGRGSGYLLSNAPRFLNGLSLADFIKLVRPVT